MRYNFSIALIFILIACQSANNSTDSNKSNNNTIASTTVLQYEIVKIHPHDTSSYTQGLEWNNNELIEGTGNYGRSILHKLNPNMKSIGKKVQLPSSEFGEGITQFKDKIYQLTWKEKRVYVYDAKTLEKIKELY